MTAVPESLTQQEYPSVHMWRTAAMPYLQARKEFGTDRSRAATLEISTERYQSSGRETGS